MTPVGKIDIIGLKESLVSDFGMIVIGAGGDISQWINGIAQELKSASIVDATVIETFRVAATITGNKRGPNGRTDLVLFFDEKARPNIGKLALWRLNFGDISWIDDFIDNHGLNYSL